MGVTLPRILLRTPYTLKIDSIGGIRYSESSAHASKDHYVWGKANFAFAKVLIREFSEVGWFSHIRGVPRDEYSGYVTGIFKLKKVKAIVFFLKSLQVDKL